jgi:hypothetical protein
MLTKIVLATLVGAAPLLAITEASPAAADIPGYLEELRAAGVPTGMFGVSDVKAVQDGELQCHMLHDGMTPQQILDGNPPLRLWIQEEITAAQHQLC